MNSHDVGQALKSAISPPLAQPFHGICTKRPQQHVALLTLLLQAEADALADAEAEDLAHCKRVLTKDAASDAAEPEGAHGTGSNALSLHGLPVRPKL